MNEVKTKGYKSTEFWVTILVIVLGIVVMAAEVAVKTLTGESLGVSIQNVFYVLFGTSGIYTGSRTVKKTKVLSNINSSEKIQADLEMSSNQLEMELNHTLNPKEEYLNDLYDLEELNEDPENLEDIDKKEDTTRIPMAQSFGSL